MTEIYLNDCLNVLENIPNESIDLVVTDCPYKIVSGGCTNNAVKIGKTDSIYIKQGKIFEHNDIEFGKWMPEVYRVLKNGTHCYVMINPRNLKELWEEAEAAGFTFQNLLVWDKGNVTPNKWYMNGYELILMLRKGKARNINHMGTKNILSIPNNTDKLHPSEKPVDLMKILVENSANKGDTVLDPFMGVGGGRSSLSADRPKLYRDRDRRKVLFHS